MSDPENLRIEDETPLEEVIPQSTQEPNEENVPISNQRGTIIKRVIVRDHITPAMKAKGNTDGKIGVTIKNMCDKCGFDCKKATPKLRKQCEEQVTKAVVFTKDKPEVEIRRKYYGIINKQINKGGGTEPSVELIEDE